MADWWDNGPVGGPCPGRYSPEGCYSRLEPVGNTSGGPHGGVLVQFECEECGLRASFSPGVLRESAKHTC